MQNIKNRITRFGLFLGLIGFLVSFAAAQKGILRGMVAGDNSAPLSGASVVLTFSSGKIRQTRTDPFGKFYYAGLEPGFYDINIHLEGYKNADKSGFLVEAEQEVFIRAFLGTLTENASSQLKILNLDFSSAVHQTFLPPERIHDTPSAHNVWALLENQDLSAISNQIDVGGWQNGIPVLFSSRGSCSWTQNRYLLNGMDVTDPYQTGKPLFYPDYFSLNSYNLMNAGHPPFCVHPGGYLSLTTLPETESFHGSVSGYYLNHSLQDSNISSHHEEHGLSESHTFNYLSEGNIRISGPIAGDNLSFSSSFSAFDVSRKVAEFSSPSDSSLISGLFSLKYTFSGHELKFFWTGQNLHHPRCGAERGIPVSATTDRKESYQVYQFFFQPKLNSRHHIKAGIGFCRGDTNSSFQEGEISPYTAEKFKNAFRGSAPASGRNLRSTLTFMLKGRSFLYLSRHSGHILRYGIELQHASADSELKIPNNLHLHFFQGQALEAVQYNSPYRHKETGWSGHVYLQDTLSFSSLFSFYFGGVLSFSRAGFPVSLENVRGADSISWINFAPRLGLIFPLNKSKTSVFKLSYGRYHFTLPLSYLVYGNPSAPGARVYQWDDFNKDNQFQPEEKRTLLRKEGPAYAAIDPELKRPYLDEAALSYQTIFGGSWSFTLAGFFRATRNLIRTRNTGVPFSAYIPRFHIDKGDDRVPFTYDDLIFTVFDQKRSWLGKDFYLLSNAESNTRTTNYFGLDLYLQKKWGEQFTFFLTFTAIHCIGTANPGNTAYQNDDGVLGSLFYSPNSLINVEGRLHFDRGYTGRLGFRYLAPWGFRISAIAKYYDGQPFARLKIINGLTQGPVFIQTAPRGKARYSFNQTVDIRIEKVFELSGSRIKIILDGFNMLNLALDTEENYWTGPDYPERYPTEIQSPRVFRIGIAYEF